MHPSGQPTDIPERAFYWAGSSHIAAAYSCASPVAHWTWNTALEYPPPPPPPPLFLYWLPENLPSEWKLLSP
ncbi:hypothetical protein EYF80_011582 [Liparis tanakae]|uniref:Uncharacterized protein n=1 Tax=Liparis tanakae TaxID=230148 RepID=A0A4Z2IJW0_9TELE|nr:hypothetical protein EYF80_011582 [Liparis tanakae]